jgi:photosystem II stability/assembly factor-like uncharacterized protein
VARRGGICFKNESSGPHIVLWPDKTQRGIGRGLRMTKRIVVSSVLCAVSGILALGPRAGVPLPLEARTQARRPIQQGALEATAEPKFKAIWEPVNSHSDVNLRDVFFVDAKVGWVAGGERDGGVILKTQDGGENWTVEWGDPHGSESGPTGFFFLDATHGWVRQGYDNLLHTTDGQHWVLAGKIDPSTLDYVFTSEKTGVSMRNDDIRLTTDGGRTWKVVNHCAADVEVEGYARVVECGWSKLHFPTATTGYVVGYISSMKAPRAVIGKTLDGGATWSVSVVDGLAGGGGDVFFFDPNTGFMRAGEISDGQLYKTTDGGATWKLLAAVPGKRFRFVDRAVGWSFLGREFHFTIDGGLHWSSRNIPFPVEVNAWSLPSRDRGYVVGDHGTIYRYRVVPVEYAAKNVIAAPGMPIR